MTLQNSRFFSFGFLLFMLVPAAGFGHIWPLNSAIADGLALLVGGLVAGGFLILARDSQFTVSPVLGIVITLVLVTGISVVMNTYVLETSWRWYLICLFLSAFIVLGAADMLRAEGVDVYVKVLINALWLGAVLYAVLSLLRYYGILQLILPWQEASGGRLGGIWSQPNLTSTTVWLGLLASVMRFDWREAPYKLGTSVLLFGWVVACAASRMSWLHAAGLLVLVGVSNLPALRTTDTGGKRIGLALSVAATVVLFFVVPLANDPLGRWLTDLGMVDRSETTALMERDLSQDSARLSEFAKLSNAVTELPVSTLILGVGPGQYATFSAEVDLKLAPEDLFQATWQHSHNLFTMVFVELGLVGLALIVVTVVSIGWRFLRRPIGQNEFFLAGALGLIFIHSNLEFPLWYPWFLLLLWLLLVPLFRVRSVRSDLQYLKPAVGAVIGLMTVALLINVGVQYRTIVQVASDPAPDRDDLQAIGMLANDSLMGPYAVLRRYRDFAPEKTNLDWQLREVRRIKAWQPRDLVMLREYSLLILMLDIEAACEAGEQTAYRYPRSGPIMLEHAMLAETLSPNDVIRLAECIERGLVPWGETIPSMKAKNAESLRRLSQTTEPSAR